MKVWKRIQKEMRSMPVVEGRVGTSTPIYCQRFLLDGQDRRSRALPILSMGMLFGGAKVQEGDASHRRSQSLPTQGVLVPVGCDTHWHYSGTADVALFYFLDTSSGIGARLLELSRNETDPLPFSNALINATALEILDELQKGSAADTAFIDLLVQVMLEKLQRCLTTPAGSGFAARHAHFNRLQKVLPHIAGNLAQDLSLEKLAVLAGVSVRHFRRLFFETMAVTPHQYVQTARLEQAHRLLGATSMPIAKIVADCGFGSQSHLTAQFRKAYALTPGQLRRHLQQARVGAPAS
jgi:AraC family transcriptional regulator